MSGAGVLPLASSPLTHFTVVTGIRCPSFSYDLWLYSKLRYVFLVLNLPRRYISQEYLRLVIRSLGRRG